MSYAVKRGKTKVQCSRTKRLAQKKAKALRAAGAKKVRIVKNGC
jgi:hypothetical protein